MRFLTAGFLLTSFAALAGPTPSDSNCQFYLDLEEEMQCQYSGEGPGSNYLVPFGYKFCRIFQEEARHWNRALREWQKQTSLCLQESLAHYQAGDSCRQLENEAFRSHPRCYAQAGYCDLARWEKRQIMATATRLDVLLRPRKSFVQALRLMRECR